ncbi:isoaspartyl peptidase/L-asparaginase family protein [Natronogracilivirga saccharolytica]|uniref:Isoaspartyl peptidase n=1 Tax=Natronogracilivirga saccharolytica TaxID=2812953 RepID=A0A8J7RW20_9BACT|nr:isoaspartyl peptidase/L-asparaginase [Natronogracilivirga saccharolytica]MBP3193992.1 isoaspartyl peptidase/L-asparaginase [Natronogracilivirga saccharolytica]
MQIPAIAIHGGSGTIVSNPEDPASEKQYLNALNNALDSGYKLLAEGCSATECVCKAVTVMEDCDLFNAGKGSVFTARGKHEMDAAIMDGMTLKAGAVAGLQGVKNPILVAYDVLHNTPFVFIAGKEAIAFARQKDFKFESDSYFYTQLRYDQWQEIRKDGEMQLDHSGEGEKFGTVGAVAVDTEGNVAAATSTGGMTNKAWGRVGDSPLIGAGTYANNKTCAVSCTGHGEYFICGVVAYDVSCRMEYGGENLNQAANSVINEKLKRMGGEGGLIAVDSSGNICMPFNTGGMYRGMKNKKQTITRIY